MRRCDDHELAKWKGGRYGYGQPLIAGDHLIVLTESGDVVLVKATPDRHEEVARFSAIEGKTWNHPVVATAGCSSATFARWPPSTSVPR